MERRSFLKHTGLAGILAAGSRAGVRAGRARSQVAPRVELPQEPRHDLRRRRDDLQARRGGDRRQVPDPGVRRAARSCRRSASSTPCRTARSSAATPRRTTSSARTRRSRFGSAIPFGLNARQQNAWMYHGGGLRADARVLQGLQHHQLPGGQHRRADGRLVPQGDQDRRRPQGPQDAHRRLRRRGAAASSAWCRSRSPAATSIPRWRRARSTRPNGSVRTTTRSSASTRSPSTTTTPAGGKAVPSSTSSSTRRRGTSCRRSTRRSLEAACGEANVDMVAKYDALNPAALQRLVAGGAQLRPFSQRDHGGLLQGGARGLRRDRRPRTRTSRRSTSRGRSSATSRSSGSASPRSDFDNFMAAATPAARAPPRSRRRRRARSAAQRRAPRVAGLFFGVDALRAASGAATSAAAPGACSRRLLGRRSSRPRAIARRVSCCPALLPLLGCCGACGCPAARSKSGAPAPDSLGGSSIWILLGSTVGLAGLVDQRPSAGRR